MNAFGRRNGLAPTRFRRAALGAAVIATVAGPSGVAATAPSSGTRTKIAPIKVVSSGAATSGVQAKTLPIPTSGDASTAGAVSSPAPSGTLPPRSSGIPVKGFGLISDEEWPSGGDGVIAAVTGTNIEVWRAPEDRVGVLRLDQGKSVHGALRLLALGASGDWVKVAIPVRPNGTVGWVRASEVQLQKTPFRIAIELSTNTMRVYEGDRIAVQTTVAAGTGSTPTPKGLFFVREQIKQANPAGSLGPLVLGLSGYSTVLQTFSGGVGTIGIHGTNAPGKLGGDVSHGCVRVNNTVISKVAALVPIGTPVEITERFADSPTRRVSSAWIDGVGRLPSAAVAAATPLDATPLAPATAPLPAAGVVPAAPAPAPPANQ